MIVVSVTQNQITVEGHAGFDEIGKDIICAAVSVLTQNLINSVCALTKDVIDDWITPGYIDIKYENLSEQGRLLVDSFFIGICAISTEYGQEYVQII